MPDKDLFQRTFAPGWRRVYRMADGGKSSDAEIGAAGVTALAKSLRESKGCPGFNEIVEIVSNVEHEQKNQPLFAAGGVLNLSKHLEAIRQVELKYEEHRVTKVATRTARAFIAKGPELVGSDKALKQDLAERICLDLVDHQFFGRGRNYFVQHRFGSFDQEREWEYHVKENMKSSLSKIAAKLVKNPNATNIRSPNRIGIRMSTQELLDEPLM
jgi:hypothetical protein